MLNFPDNPTADQIFDATAKASFIWKLSPDRWRRQPPVPVDPMVTFIDPNHGLVNTAHPCTVWGQGFTAGCKVYLQGVPGELPTTFFSTNELRVTIPANATPQTVLLWVVMDGVTTLPPTAGLPFVYDRVPLVLTSLNPGSLQQNAATQNAVVQLLGSGFTPTTFAVFKGFLAATTYVSPTRVDATAVDIRTAGTFPMLARETQGSVDSNTLDFFVTSNQPPSLISVSPNSVQQGATIATLTVTGVNLVNGKRIKLDGVAVPTTFVNATTLTTANVLTKVSYPNMKVEVEDTPGTLYVTLVPLPGSVQIGDVWPDIWPHSHQTNPYYGRNFISYPGGYSDNDEVWIRDSGSATVNWILHDSWPEGGALMFQASYLGKDPAIKTYADVMVKKNGVQTGNTARLLIGGS